jgi:predicted nucleic acid-binding protein
MDWLQIEPDRSLPVEISGWDLGTGESQALAVALTFPGWEVVLDDLDARRCARSLGIPTTGTLGVVLRAKKTGIIPEAYPLVQELIRKGAYLSPGLIDSALRKVGEGGG